MSDLIEHTSPGGAPPERSGELTVLRTVEGATTSSDGGRYGGSHPSDH